MIEAQKPIDEEDRLKELYRYRILDTMPESDFDDFVNLAAEICNTPIALISLIDPGRQWFKAKRGIDAVEAPREIAFCSHAILQDDVLTVEDATKDPRFFDNPLVLNGPNVKFYSGAPLVTPSGQKIGTLCVIDQKPRKLSPKQLECLKALSRQIINVLEFRYEKIQMQNTVRIKEEALAIMSHEIRTPLSGVLGLTDLALDSNLNANELREYLNRIDKCSKSLYQVTSDILDFTKFNSLKFSIELKPTNIEKLFHSTFDSFEKQFQMKNLKLDLSLPDHIPAFLELDELRVIQVLQNLLTNALKYTETGNVQLVLQFIKANDEVGVQISVIDTGIGLSKSELNALFEPYKQFSQSATRRERGTGLGLYICQKLIEAMAGKISVESKLGIGTCFKIIIPTKESIKQDHVQDSVQTYPTELGLDVLVAEDNKTNQIIIQKYLEKFGCSYTTVENGLEAFHMFQSKNFDVILMDCMMPIMDGYEASKKINDSANKDVPLIIALTASIGASEIQKCKNSGMYAYASKPINKAELFSLLCDVANKKKE